MPGDKVNIEVYAKYYDPSATNDAGLASLMNAIISGINVPAGTFVDGAGYGLSTNLPFTPGWGAKAGTGAPPMAYLNWMVFDRDYSQDLGRSGYMRITTNAKETGTNATHDKLFSPEITITQPGYVYIWLSNENPTPVEVYFDDFKVTQVKSPVIQQDDYYAFGLVAESYSRENSLPNQYKYNSMELQDELNLGWYDYIARQYDPAIGRFLSVDPHADNSRRWSPYSYAYNNPIRFIDPDGMDADDQVKRTNESKIISTNTNKNGETTIVERTTSTTTSTHTEVDSDGNTTTTETTTRTTTTSTTVINEKGEVVDNSATSSTDKRIAFQTTDSKGNLVGDRGDSGFVNIKPEQSVNGGFMGVKTEALAVIAQENYKTETGPWYSKEGWKSLFRGLSSQKVTQPSNGSQEVAPVNGVKYRSDGKYTREDSMRMEGSNYNGPPLSDRERLKLKKRN
jgi:RHS repeat-associated protein